LGLEDTQTFDATTYLLARRRVGEDGVPALARGHRRSAEQHQPCLVRLPDALGERQADTTEATRDQVNPALPERRLWLGDRLTVRCYLKDLEVRTPSATVAERDRLVGRVGEQFRDNLAHRRRRTVTDVDQPHRGARILDRQYG